MIEIPREFVDWTIAREGDPGRSWVESLPALVDSYLDRWALVAEGPVWHGYVGVALPVTRADGQPAVLKASWLDDESRGEPYVLAAWAGRGAVMLLDRDESAGVMLLERLDETRTVRELDGESAARVAGEVCARLAVPAPVPTGPSPWALPRVSELADRWVADLPARWNRLGRPFPRGIVDAAVATCREFGPDQPDRLLHGDLTFTNILRGDRAPWLVIDPSGVVGEPAYDGAKLLTNRWSELAAQPDLRTAVLARVTAFAEGAGIDVVRVRRWAQARLVNDALWSREHQPDVVPYVDALASMLV